MKLQKQMLEKGIMVGRAFPSFDDWCRISTGTPHEVIMLNDALKKIISYLKSYWSFPKMKEKK